MAIHQTVTRNPTATAAGSSRATHGPHANGGSSGSEVTAKIGSPDVGSIPHSPAGAQRHSPSGLMTSTPATPADTTRRTPSERSAAANDHRFTSPQSPWDAIDSSARPVVARQHDQIGGRIG